ncbi:glycosyltransferase, group 1 family protein [Finegoldia magna SY403409CC001050417]|uniref:Glycosyltransferase family 4 protein n=1 Tax=Finegoldia magna TaxID=1260 RepID=A0A7D4JL50_FINMA|nr:glycosyltransferase family 4 protein [Finegoldia magna]EGS35263.1 glycosyltransferase, group 1 family protein [Finegoldia magna SY403409CC001050417]QKH78920.1 glycosyltransferase family 4 protein [Finegoldia magna]
MKILHVIAQLPKQTGSGVYFTNVIQFMQQSHENAAVFGIQDDIKLNLDESIKTYPVEFKSEKLNFPIVGMSDEMPYDSTKYSDMTHDMIEDWTNEFTKQLKKAKQEFKPDVIVSHHCWMLSSLVLDIFDETPVLLLNHGTDIRQTNLNPELFMTCVNNLNRAKKALALSKKDVEPISDIFEIDKEKIVVMGGGYNSNIFYRRKEDPHNERITLLFAGKLSHAKGVYELCKAFKKLEEKYDNLELTLVGDVDIETKIELWDQTANSLHFDLHNTSCQKNLSNKMRASDIYVLPSYYEGLGLIAIEALGCGMRVVVTEIEGLIQTLDDEINNSTAIEFVKMPRLKTIDKPYESEIEPFVDRLAQAIEKQIIRVQNQEPIPEKIHELVLNHSWDHIMLEIENELMEIVEK